MTITNSTITTNELQRSGGGIFTDSGLTLNNSIVAGNRPDDIFGNATLNNSLTGVEPTKRGRAPAGG